MIRQIEIPGGHGKVSIEQDGEKVVIHRLATRGNIKNRVDNYESIDDKGNSCLLPLTLDVANSVLDRILQGRSYPSAFLFEQSPSMVGVDLTKSEMEHKFTSTGIKFWRHAEQMTSYLGGTAGSVISTHVSPEGACNLKCPYCSVTYRDTHSRIDLAVIYKYVEDLQSRGLKAVILTGGGEPTAYPWFNQLAQWIKYERQLSVALITNGTLASKVEAKTWKAFSWVRVSLNVFDGWEQRIGIPISELSADCVLGCSMIYTGEHESTKEKSSRLEILKTASRIAERLGAKYVRLLPNCLLPQRELLLQHRALALDLAHVGDSRFFHQHKIHGAPRSDVCHQAYFRPYLSEEKYHENGLAGTVYPCDSVVLNDTFQHFAKEYQICHATQVLDFLDGKLNMRFNPKERCKGCVFTDNVNMLEDWKKHGVGQFKNHEEPLVHEEFV